MEWSAQDPQLWVSPLNERLQVTRAFSLPDGPYRAGHRGIDLAGSFNEAVLAPSKGTVVFVGTVVDRPVISIRIDEHTLLSLEPVRSDLSVGTVVARGATIGTVDAGSHCETGCVHLGVRVDDRYVQPLRFLRSRPQLLPWGGDSASLGIRIIDER